MMKGIKWSRPTEPKYKSFWDVRQVLTFLVSLGDNGVLSLEVLSAKLALLLCLVALKRTSDIRALDISRRSFLPGAVRFDLVRRTKTNLPSIVFPAFDAEPCLCVVRCLREYELRTESLRADPPGQLLISFVRPYRPVSSPTIARWIWGLLQQSGIDTSIFGAHSVRGASASKAAILGFRIEDILRTADWSKASTFSKFYHRDILPSNTLNILTEALN
nr:PREDICTED: uncharacterized protein LOC106703295 [Latimeria chalumnae]|eukprot:XP_014343339.1 PREDICTED: uncharacterized protein LOC106703295 [Latimeria chalumnae]